MPGATRTPKPSRPPPGGPIDPRPRFRPPDLKGHARRIVTRLGRQYGDATCALHHASALELAVATILSAQCTDARVNIVTPALFAKYRAAGDYAAADPRVLEREIQSTGFFRNKTKSIIGMAQALLERHGGDVPATMAELTALPGIGRKTANVILGTWFRKNDGVVVDTHVQRVSRRLGLTRETDPVKIERDLMQLIPQSRWTWFSHALIHHGRGVCVARRPRCEACVLNQICPSSLVIARP